MLINTVYFFQKIAPLTLKSFCLNAFRQGDFFWKKTIGSPSICHYPFIHLHLYSEQPTLLWSGTQIIY